MLEVSSPSKHNAMLGDKIKHPKSTNFDDAEDFEKRPIKRLRLSPEPREQKSSQKSSPRKRLQQRQDRVIPDSDDDDAEEIADISARDHQTNLESALPPIKTDQEAIEEYEATRAAEAASSSSSSSDLEGRLNQRKWIRGKSSIYVDAFNLALETVLEDESHLFNEGELAVFEHWRSLSYEAQYLYVRLFLRKAATWFRINRLGYHSDIADLNIATEELQTSRGLPGSEQEEMHNPGEFEPPIDTELGEQYTFADRSSDCITTLEEASSLLLLDELKAIAKDAKVQGKNKTELLRALRRASGKQTGLGFASLKRSDTEDTAYSTDSGVDGSREGTPHRENRDAHYVGKILAETGPCIRLSGPTLKLFERVHLVFYRSTEWTEKSLTTIILARIARWNFPEYLVSRSANIFASRPLLLEFEASLRTQFRLDSIMEFNGTPTKFDLQGVLDVFEDVLPRWRVLLDEEQKKEDSIYATGEGAYLRRLSPAWVYTRIVHKGAYVLGKFKQHKREHETLCELLNQRLFHTSRRGDWYQRKALLEEHYMHALTPAEDRSAETQKKHYKRIALQTCEVGLEDPLVHLIYHHDLQKRVTKLEKQLKIPKRNQHDFGHVRLAKAAERTFKGIQIIRGADRSTPTGTSTDDAHPSTPKPSRRGAKTIWIDPAPAPPTDPTSDVKITDPPLVSVESMCLSQYRALGYRGYHSEGSIIRTLFGYLFYDVLFVYMPNVFQTAYQTCPLDLHTDAFYASRLSEINARLNEICNGGAEDIVKRVWEEHAEKRTCIVGLDWSFDINDLRSVVRVFPPTALADVCKVMAQEYASRGGGVPDLFLWKEEEEEVEEGGIKEEDEEVKMVKRGTGKGEVMFAEVKSENDRLSDTQRLWIDVLSGAGVRVELCNAVAEEVRVVD